MPTLTYVPTRRLSVVVIGSSGVWIDGHPLTVTADMQLREAALDTLARGARRRGTRLTAKVVDTVNGTSLTIEVHPDGASDVIEAPPSADTAAVCPDDGGADPSPAIETDIRTARLLHLEGAYERAAELWLRLAEDGVRQPHAMTAHHLARGAAAWQRGDASHQVRWSHARRLMRGWTALVEQELLSAADREMWQRVHQCFLDGNPGERKEPGLSGPPPARPWRDMADLVLHSKIVGGAGAPRQCICFMAVCGSALHHGGTADLCPWHVALPVEQYHFSTLCSSR